MIAKRMERCGVAGWLVVVTLMFGLNAGAQLASNPPNQASSGAQEKKDEKKEEKKEEKKLSLKSDRKIEFTTDEGTWISLDVSPDGKTIAFELLGDIYTMPMARGEAKLIDGGMAFDSQPKFSPDGKWIAFLSDRDGNENVWIMRADGSEAKQLSKDASGEFASPSWAPDGNYVFVSKAGFGIATFEIWMYHVQGGSGVQVTKAKPAPTTPRQERHNAMGAVAPQMGNIFTTQCATADLLITHSFRCGKSRAATAKQAMRTFCCSNWRAASDPCYRRMERKFCM